jgi:ketosteroid isomerase-like protein
MNTDGSEMAQKFMDSLKKVEQEQDVSPLLELFSEDATLERLTHKTYKGKDDARAFWEEYLEPFEEVRTEFFNVTEDGESIVLEWASQGRLQGGKEIHYRGVSSFDVADGAVKSFRTYYDSAAFLSEGASK